MDTTIPDPFSHPDTMDLAREVLQHSNLSDLPALDRWIKAKLQDAIEYKESAVFIALMCNVVENFLPENMLARFRQLPIAPHVTHDGAGLKMKIAALKHGRAMLDEARAALDQAIAARDTSVMDNYDFEGFLNQWANDFCPNLLIRSPRAVAPFPGTPDAITLAEAILKKE